jgi:thioredoxin-dependent peroxiredoxin
VNWKPGEDVVVPAAMSEDDVKKKFPGGLRTLKPYLRFGAQPK